MTISYNREKQRVEELADNLEKAEEKRKRKEEKRSSVASSFREIVPTNSKGRSFGKRISKGSLQRRSLQKIRHNKTGVIINVE